MRVIFSLILILLFSCSKSPKKEPIISYEALANDINILASDSFAGRAPFTEGEVKTINYLSTRMQEIGLEPAFDGSYFQTVPLVEIVSKISQSVKIRNNSGLVEYSVGHDFTLWSPLLRESVALRNSELVFAGYGISAPEWNWNDFEGIDFTGKTLVVLVNDPGFYTKDEKLFNGFSMTYYGRWSYKFDIANKVGANGCIIVHEDEAAGYPWSVVNRRTNSGEFYLNNQNVKERNCVVNGWITRDAALNLFTQCGMDYEEMKAKASTKGFKPMAMGASVSVEIENSWKEANSYNVGGIIRGSTRPEEALVYTAHWDHLGVGQPINGDSIYNGASDNAAAIAWMLSIAKAFMDEGKAPERSILFLAPTAEEAGMIGSQHYVDNPVFEHKNTVACFNSDVILFLGKFKDVTITGLGHSELDKFLEEEAKKQGRYICNDPNPENGMFFRSDQMPFLRVGIPSLFAKGYTHQVELGREATLIAVTDYWKTVYHKPSDHYIPEKHSLDGLLEDAILFYRLGNRLANDSYFPKWNRESEFYVER
jgi:Zn-dependent M28 family amino/carboxypeptidase